MSQVCRSMHWRALGGWLQTVARLFRQSVLDFLFPPACPACGQEQSHPSSNGATAVAEGSRLCEDCLTKSGLDSPITTCPRCAAPIGPYLDNAPLCIHCRTDRFAFERVYSLGTYERELQTWILRMKHAGNESLAAGLAREALTRHEDDWKELDLHAVVAVPQHWLDRIPPFPAGTESLARMIAHGLRLPLLSLRKTTRTPKQSGLTPTERRRNLKKAFFARRSRFEGKRILIVDDVLTTGTTSHEVAVALRRAGAEKSWVFAAARGIGETRPGFPESMN